MSPSSVAELSARLEAVLTRLSALELAAGVTPADALAARQLALLKRLDKLEARCGLGPATAVAPAAAAADAAAGELPEVRQVDPGGSEVQRRLQAELLERGISRHKFVRAPPEYYDRPLEFR
jgi:hypothetical protein